MGRMRRRKRGGTAPCKLNPAAWPCRKLISGVSAVEPIHLFEVAAQQVRWLSTSQSVIAANVSNANTPGYRSQIVQPFSDVMDKTQLQLASTNASHLELDPIQAQAASIKDDTPWEVTDSGNSVSLEQEMIKASDVNRSYSLNTSLVKAFHGMLMASVRS